MKVKNQIQDYLVYVILLVALICGVIGYKLKKCDTFTPNVVVTHDTFYSSYPVYIEAESTPKNEPTLKKEVKYIAVVDKDTVFIEKEYPTFISTDTISPVKGFHIAILDNGNCYGIINRKTTTFGELPERIITKTVTNTIEKQAPLLSLYAGAQGSFSTKWKAIDVGPSITLSIKNKHSIGYGYQLNTGTHSLNLQTKIK